ncbi:MAG: xanthine dehydrogenase family protein molybdopterin-binding subunit [Candidatus Caldarchaeales archaeon]
MDEEVVRRFEEILRAREFFVVGKRVARVDALDAVLGRPMYTSDLLAERPLVVRAVRSPHPHALIRRVDPSAARAVEGVVDAITHREIPGANLAGSLTPDRPLLAVDRVRHFGEAVALVVGVGEEAAEEGVRRFRVEYEPVPAVFDPVEALDPRAPKVQEQGNLVNHVKIRKGNVEEGFARSDVVLRNEFRTPFMDGLPIEIEVAYAYPDLDGGVTCIASMQNPFDVHARVSAILGLPPEKVRVVQAATGGGFGPKSDESPIDVAAYASLAAIRNRRPALATFTREEAMAVQTKRHRFVIVNETGATSEGRLLAWRSTLYADTGAYISKGHLVIQRATFHCTGPYEVPNVWADGYAVLTNNTVAGSTRGFGAPQALFAAEVQMDLLAKRLEMDPFELRAMNALRPGSLTATSQRIDDDGLVRCIERARSLSRWSERRSEYRRFNSAGGRYRRGIGVALLYHGNTLGPEGDDYAIVHLRAEPDGTLKLHTGLTEYGTGAMTSLAMIAAEAFGLRVEDVQVLRPDTSAVKNPGPTVASRTTVIGGRAALAAAAKLRERLESVAAELLGCGREEVEFAGGRVGVRGDPSRSMSFAELVRRARSIGVETSAEGYYKAPDTRWDKETGQGAPYNQYTFGALVSEVEVDTVTGLVRVIRMTAVYDVGRAINPLGLQAVIEGGSIMGLGHALTEEMLHVGGVPVTLGLQGYLIPSSAEVPGEIVHEVVESPGPIGALGAKAMGEIPVVLPMASIANAVADAIGVHTKETPLKPELVLRALAEAGLVWRPR